MIEPRNSTRRYMDFVGPRRSSATDPLISRPVARKSSASADSSDPLAQKAASAPVKSSAKPPVKSSPETILPSDATPRSRHSSRAPIRPVSASRPAAYSVASASPAPSRHTPHNLAKSSAKPTPVAVKQTEEKALVSRKPNTAPKEYYPTVKTQEQSTPAVVNTSSSSLSSLESLSNELLDDSFATFSGSGPSADSLSASPRVRSTDRPHDDLARKASSALSGTSPFLSSYNVDKRPLSNSIPEKKPDAPFEKVSYLGVNDSASDSPRRKKLTETAAEDEFIEPKGKKPEKIIDSSPTSVIPTVLIILITIILGAAAGAGVYFLVAK